ncbi:regulatory LuxR family protein [Luteimicrobium subarcticum]|uniref:Regulatory LuxR family protein n=1 Tax=Luteimicrobium subarcticum TaxID=620910 RepID=A0A2M8WVZ2_9MICO|nr:regulatory LuxR family protein [Luteimicrobium subarcticum]
MIVTFPNRPGGTVAPRRRDHRRGRTGTYSTRTVELERAAALVADRRGGIVWRAEPGMGKSATLDRVVDHLLSRPTTQELVVVRLRSGSVKQQGAAVTSIVTQVQQATGIDAPAWMCSVETLVREGTDPGGVVVALADYLGAVQDDTTVVLVADDLDLVDPTCIDVLLGLVGRRTRGLVLLGTISGTRDVPGLTYPIEVRDVPALGWGDALDLLWNEVGVACAPHVAARLVDALGGNAAAVSQVAQVLTGDQLAGWSALPEPLPVTSAARGAVGPLDDLGAADRGILLVAALASVRRTDVLLAACGITGDDLLTRPCARHLDLTASRFAFVDPRVRAVVHSDASLSERSAAHHALARVHAATGERDAATWHAALATIQTDPALGAPLVALAARMFRDGDADGAYDVAREAASHCSGPDLESAIELVVRAALHAGYVVDAAGWGRGGMRSHEDGVLGRGIGAFLTAVTLTDGQVPDEVLDKAERRAAGDPDQVAGVVVGAARAATLHAERGDGTAAREALALAERLADALGDGFTDRLGAVLEETRVVCEVFGVTTSSPRAVPPGTVRRTGTRAAMAIRAAQAGNLASASAALASALSELAPLSDGAGRVLGDCVAATPLEEAQLWVAKVLVDVWSGQLATARQDLAEAAYRLPVGMPFAGLGVALARRLDVLVTGSVGRLASALEETMPGQPGLPLRHAALEDRALLAIFDDEPAQAATLLELSDGRELPHDARLLPLPADDEVAVWCRAGRPDAAARAAARARARAAALPGEMRVAAEARLDVLLAEPGSVLAAAERGAMVSRSLASAFERARTELVVGRALVGLGDELGGGGHLFSALELFREAGASAWSDVVLADLAAVDGRGSGGDAPQGGTAEPASGVTVLELADRLRTRWAGVLTDRELDVALLVVEGASNREVAETLFVSVRTVEVHLGRVFRKLGVRSRLELTVLAHRGGPGSGD